MRGAGPRCCRRKMILIAVASLASFPLCLFASWWLEETLSFSRQLAQIIYRRFGGHVVDWLTGQHLQEAAPDPMHGL